MKQLFRLLKILLFSRFGKQLGIFDEGVVSFLVWPNDLDPLLHMNNGAYLTLLDLGRIDLSIRTGLMRKLRRNGIYGVVASQAIKFRKSLGPFARFSIRTKMIYWDDRYFYFQQYFMRKNEVAATAVVKARFLRKNGERVAPAEIFKLMDYSVPTLQPPELARKFLELDSELR